MVNRLHGYQLALLCVLTLIIQACTDTYVVDKHYEISNMTEIKILTIETGELILLQKPEQITTVLRVLEQKQRSYNKLLPIFSHRISITRDQQTEHWLLNKSGYLKSENDQSGSLYKINQLELLVELL